MVIVTDWSPPDAARRGQLMSDRQMSFLVGKLRKFGFGLADCVLINPCPINPSWAGKPPTAKQHSEWVKSYSNEFRGVLDRVTAEAKVVLCLGKSAAMQVCDKTVAVTKVRGQFITAPTTTLPVIVTLSPAHVQSRLEVEKDFDTDMEMVSSLRKAKWKASSFAKSEGKYEICTDLSEWLNDPPPCIALDTETTGLQWAKDATVICIPLTAEEGYAKVIPISGKMFPDITRGERMQVLAQLRKLTTDTRIKFIGHNFKFDLHMLSLLNVKLAPNLSNWWMDTLQLAFAADENMQSKSLKECTRRWVREMAGYSDSFDAETDKADMISVKQEDLIKYAGGDTDATFRLCRTLVEEIRKDKKQWQNVVRTQMPALRMFWQMEQNGMKIDERKLRTLGTVMRDRSFELEKEMLRMVPKKVKQKHFEAGLSFGRRDFLADILFSEDGFKLVPKVTNKDGTPKLDATHLTYFATHKFVSAYSEYQKTRKMATTYIGEESMVVAKGVKLLKNGGWPVAVKRITNKDPEEMQDLALIEKQNAYLTDEEDTCMIDILTEWSPQDTCLGRSDGQFFIVSKANPTGFWKHIATDGKIHPSFFLDRTVTGRSSSKEPNFQNLPKRGELAKPFRRVFVPSRPKYVFLECDLSQAELRIAAVESLDPVMIEIYRTGGDIHATTGAKVAGVALKDVTKEHRQKAKAVNFGFLYTMGVDGFIVYAKTQYGVEFTKKEAELIRETYFNTYKKLKDWHEKRKQEARANGFVRSILGGVRHLPSINSSDRGVQAEAERQAINSPIQRVASDLTLLSMQQFSVGCPDWIIPNGTIHDSGIAEVEERRKMKAAAWMKWCFCNPPIEKLYGVKLPIPMGADVAMGYNLGDMEELKDLEAIKPPWIH